MENNKITYSVGYIPHHKASKYGPFPPMTGRHSRELSIFFNENHDYCTSCRSPFSYTELTHLGFDFNDQFIYACNKCATKVKETVVRYGYTPRKYRIPNYEAPLWRYMDFTKYISLLHSKALFFCSAALFNDPFEGARGLLVNREIYENGQISALAQAIADRPDATEIIPPSESDFIKAAELTAAMASHREKDKSVTFINCWHENEVESDGMWYLYSKDVTNAIAVRSTYQRLYLAIDKDPNIDIGGVNYIDYSTNFTPANNEYWYKRTSFSHEREVRAIARDHHAEGKSGLYVPINLSVLIDKVYISPKSNGWFADLVKDINVKYGIDVEVLHSDLGQRPFY